MPRVLLATCAALPSGDADDDGLVAALASVGVTAAWAPWDSATCAEADLVVLRSTWDYPERRGEFLDWCEQVPRLANAAPVVRWSTDKVYLRDLAARGVPVVPTRLLPPGSPLPPDVAAAPDGVVLKPAVGAGARGAGWFTGPTAAARHLAHLHDAGRTVVLQPFQPDVARSGEVAMVFLAGDYSHAFRKGSLLGAPEDSSGLFRTERLGSAAPDLAQRAVAEAALDAAASQLGVPRQALLYARVDVVTGVDGAPLLLELELAEPSLGFRHADPGAPARFAAAVRDTVLRG